MMKKMPAAMGDKVLILESRPLSKKKVENPPDPRKGKMTVPFKRDAG